MNNIETGIMILIVVIFWLIIAAPSIANIYWLKSKNNQRKIGDKNTNNSI
jgi:hypothetical protein